MDSAVAVGIQRALPGRLRNLQQITGLSVLCGGVTESASTKPTLRISELVGTLGDSLNYLEVPSGRGLGGRVLQLRASCRVNDYATADVITHDFDGIVIRNERLTSVIAVPVVVDNTVHAVLYGGVRDRRPIGDRALYAAETVAAMLQRDITQTIAETAKARSSTSALEELLEIIRTTPDNELRGRLARVHHQLADHNGYQADSRVYRRLSRREIDVLRLAALGAGNRDIAAELLISAETVKTYLRNAMRKLDTPNRTAAVYAARRSGLL